MSWLLGDEDVVPQAKTVDEHDQSVAVKPFPDKEYIREMVRLWQSSRMNLWEKSRQVMASWTLCALYMHEAQFSVESNRQTLYFIQSKKEEDSDRLIQRCYTLWFNQDAWLKALYPAEYSYCHLRFWKPGPRVGLPYSEIYGIPQGGDAFRQHTVSGLLIDEGAFQPELEKSIGAAQPTIKGGGRIDVVSSAGPGYFQDLVEDRVL
jgi:hypothetical protein